MSSCDAGMESACATTLEKGKVQHADNGRVLPENKVHLCDFYSRHGEFLVKKNDMV